MHLHLSLTVLALTAAAVNAESCESSQDCVGGYCASGTCLKISKCAARQDCFNPANGPYPVPFCRGYIDCVKEHCHMECGPQLCPDGVKYVACDPDSLPCDVADCMEATSCYNDPCGGGGACKPMFFDGAGNRVCIEEPNQAPAPCATSDDCEDNTYCASSGKCLEVSKCSVVDDCSNPSNSPFPVVACAGRMDCMEGTCGMLCGVEEDTNTTQKGGCASDDACGDGSYCASGECLEVSKCSVREDCLNPANGPLSLIECTGHMDCLESGCNIVCGPIESCPDGIDYVACDDPNSLPCDVEQCEEAVSCHNDNCGGCRAVFFDSAGSQVCFTGLIGSPVTSSKCEKDGDCGDNSYCASSGECLEVSKCAVVDDCSNPSNSPFAVAACLGEMVCLKGGCQMVCGGDGGDATDPSAACDTDEDCGVDSYCAAGSCLAVSKCNEVVDCVNPSNSPYAVVACVGFLECSADNQCGIVCGASFCADGSEPVNCFADPCAVARCDGAVSCTSDYCGGCNAIFFDAAGNHICTGNATEVPSPNQGPGSPVPAVVSCQSDADCAPPTTTAVGRSASQGDLVSEPYCSQGVCTEPGACSTDADCFNPSNVFAVILCTGYLTCTQGLCEVVCGPACPDGSEGADCGDELCDVADCPGARSCSTQTCDACAPIYFDAAGFEVTTCGDGSSSSDGGSSEGGSGSNDGGSSSNDGGSSSSGGGGNTSAVPMSLMQEVSDGDGSAASAAVYSLSAVMMVAATSILVVTAMQ